MTTNYLKLFLLIVLFFTTGLAEDSNLTEQRTIIQKLYEQIEKDPGNITYSQLKKIRRDSEYILKKNNIPNCFSCSKSLLKITEKSNDKKIKISSSVFAAKISPDMPYTHFSEFREIFLYAPLKFDKWSEPLFAFMKSFDNSPFSLEFSIHTIIFIKRLLMVIFALFLAAILFKYSFPILFFYRKVFYFSKFYIFLICMTYSAVFLISLYTESAFSILFIITLFLLMKILPKREVVLFSLFIIASFLFEAFESSFENEVKRTSLEMNSPDAAFAFYSPLFHEPLKDKASPNYFLVNGTLAFYNKEYEKSSELLSIAVLKQKDKKIVAAIENILGLNFYYLDNVAKAIELLDKSYKNSPSDEVLFNLQRVLDNEDFLRFRNSITAYLETKSEKQHKFPELVMPPMLKIIYPGISLPSKRFIEVFTHFIPFLLPHLLLILILSALYFMFFKGLNIKQCPSCKCAIGDPFNPSINKQICMKCYVSEHAQNSIYTNDYKGYIEERKSKIKKLSTKAFLYSFLLPSFGLLYKSKNIEGLFYLFFILLFPFGFIYKYFPSTVFDSNGHIPKPIFILMVTSAFFYFIMIIRSFMVNRIKK